jgi:hypothetical protein
MIHQKLLLKRSAWEVVQEVLSMKEEECLKMVVFLWRWWSVRNKVNPGEKGRTCDEVAGDVIRLLGDLKRGGLDQPTRVSIRDPQGSVTIHLRVVGPGLAHEQGPGEM